MHGAIFRCDGDGSDDGKKTAAVTEELMVPVRLPARAEEATLSELEYSISKGTRMQFILEIHDKYVPAGLVAHFLGGPSQR